MAMRTKYGSYEFLMMFHQVMQCSDDIHDSMNSTFHKNLDEFLIIYIDDILLYSKTME